MKKRIISAIIAIAAITISSFTKAQESTTAEIKIITSAVCDMCKETLEKSLAFEKGVKKSDLDVKTKIITVTYNPKKITPEKIRLAIANTGYDADDVKANEKAYNKLDECCKKGKVCNDKSEHH